MTGIVGTLLFAGLMLLVTYRRFKRLRRDRHPVFPVRMLVRVGLMSVLGGGLLFLPWVSRPWLLGGLALGMTLGLYALSLTELERDERRLYFRTNSNIGMLVFLLFTARLLWRMGERLVAGEPQWVRRIADPEGLADPARMPITLVLLFIVIGYTVLYTSGILIRSRSARVVEL